MDEPQVPVFYVVNRKLPKEEVDAVMSALRITPVAASIVSNLEDSPLGFTLAAEVINAASPQDALALAFDLSRDVGRPVMVLGDADFLDAVYADGSRKPVVKHA